MKNYQSTAFFHTLKNTNKPIIILDSGVNPISNQARVLLSRRCSIINLNYNENGFLNISNDELKFAVENSIDLNSNEFEYKYHGN